MSRASECSVARHEDIKSDELKWIMQRRIGTQSSITEDGAECTLELRNCANCGSTLAREIADPSPAKRSPV